MNKLVLFPMAILIMLAIVNVTSGGGQYVGEMQFTDPSGKVTVDGASSEATFEGQGNEVLGIFSESDLIVMLGLAVAVAIAAGFSALGVGMSTLSQELLFKSTMYGGIWGILSVSSWEFFDVYELAGVGVLIWSIMTICYVLGFVSDVGGDE